jgi:hypothetical protein
MIGLSITFVVRRGAGQLWAGLASLVHSPRRKPTTDDGTVAARWNQRHCSSLRVTSRR